MNHGFDKNSIRIVCNLVNVGAKTLMVENLQDFNDFCQMTHNKNIRAMNEFTWIRLAITLLLLSLIFLIRCL